MLFRLEFFSLFVYVALIYLFDSILSNVVVDKVKRKLSAKINYAQSLTTLLYMMLSGETAYQIYLHDLIKSR